MLRSRRPALGRIAAIATALLLVAPSTVLGANPHYPGSGFPVPIPGDMPTVNPNLHPLILDEEAEQELLELDKRDTDNRLAGDVRLRPDQAASFRAAAALIAKAHHRHKAPSGPTTFGGAWTAIGPDPIFQLSRGSGDPIPVSGRIGALAIRPSTGDWLLAAAQGGVWMLTDTGWVPKTDNLPSLSMGALAFAPSNDAIVYAGTGEGALSGDSYYGNGVIKSTDGGNTWTHVSGNFFVSVSISRVVVDPTNANHLYVSVLRGRGGARRTSPPTNSQFGIWESKNGGTSWKLVKKAPTDNLGATDLEMDPQNPNILYASFWGDNIYKSTDGGKHWATAMNGLPTLYNNDNLTRWSIGISHPQGQNAVLYVGTDVIDDSGNYQPGSLWRSDDGAASWHALPTTGFNGDDDSVADYCGEQCYYDNVIEVDPTNTDIVYAAGQFNYGIGSGGIFRSDDGGQTWKNLGWDQHPDFHAFAFDMSDPDGILIGSDGGVWWSPDRGGRLPGAADEGDIPAADWESVNGFGLQITQFTSIATNPTRPARLWGGNQDNGTVRKSATSNTWVDMFGGDGGQVLVDPTDSNYVYGTYYGVSPYRDESLAYGFSAGDLFNSNAFITGGINVNDRSDFYVPFVLNQANPNQLFLGTYRLYRTDNAKAPKASQVHWNAISPDLTGGCTGTAPNGARTCALSAIGVGGGTAVYVGTLDGKLWISPDAQVSSNPTWTQVGKNQLPNRPIARIAVDRSNYRIAYVAYNGFDGATPHHPGHVFKTTDGGKHWQNISGRFPGNLPDVPVNSLIVDPSFPNTLYAGTDVGPFVTYNGGQDWGSLGSGIPIVSVEEMDLDSLHRTMAVGTHGRGAWLMNDTVVAPALVVSKVDAGVPIGPSSALDYTITLRNIGNGDATGITITDPIPSNTTFMSADSGGTLSHGKVKWTGLSVASGASLTLHFTVSVKDALRKRVKAIVNDGIVVKSAEGPGATGSPTTTSIAPPYDLTLTPATQTDGARAGSSVTYPLQIKNFGYRSDSYGLSATGGTYPTAFFQADCTTSLTTTGTVAPGATVDVCVKVSVPGGAADGDTDTSTVTATSVGSATVSASATITTIAVTIDTLLVDEDGDAPDVQSTYTDALDSAGVTYSVWDLGSNPDLPTGYLAAHKTVIWFTGNTYPGPITPYEPALTAFLDNGGRLFMNGQDILDQAAGQTDFVYDYLHIDWDGSEDQNDKPTDAVHGVTGTLSDGIGAVPIDHSVLGATFEDQVTPIGPAVGIFTDDSDLTDGLSVDAADDSSGTYKVVFLAFPFEAYGTAGDRLDLLQRVLTYFGP